MDSEMSEEGAYDAPVDQLDASSQPTDNGAAAQAAERRARLERLRQRRTEIGQNAGSVSSSLAQTSAPQPVTIKDHSPLTSSAGSAVLRNDIVQEAVGFLTDPRVASAPTATKRRFLTQKKGLTEAEVDEAFRQATSAAPSAPAAPAAPTQMAPAAPPPPGYYGAPVVYQQAPPPPAIASPSLRSIAFVVVLGVGVASVLVHLFKKYIWAYWFPRKNTADEKFEALEKKLTAANELVAAQAAEVKEAVIVVRNFLQSHISDWAERERLESLQLTQDEKALSELKREVSSVRHLIPSVGNFARSVKSTAMQSEVLEDIKNELLSLKNAVKGIVSGVPSSSSLLRLSSSSNVTSPLATDAAAATPSAPTETSSSASSTSVSAAVAPSATSNPPLSTSKRSLPSWMTQPKALPSWQMEDKDKPADGSAPAAPAAPAPASTESSVAGTESAKPITQTETVVPAPDLPQETPATENNNFKDSKTSAPLIAATDDAPYSQSYLETVRMISQGLTPPGLKTDVDDAPASELPLTAGSRHQNKKPWQTTHNASQQLNMQVEPQGLSDLDVPQNIGQLEASPSDDEEMVLDDIELK